VTQTIIFDLDGTLVNSAPDLHAASNVLLEELGETPLSLTEVTACIGHGIPHLLEQVLAARNLDSDSAHLARFLQICGADPVSHGRLYPGVKTVLQKLTKAGAKLGLCTNKARLMTEKVVAGHDLGKFFGAIVCGDDLPARKPDPLPLQTCAAQLGRGLQSVVYVGDSETDAETARRAKVPFLLFTEGYRHAPIEQLPHRAAFSRYTDFLKLLT
jgi:phosphoglycolate phosphatase